MVTGSESIVGIETRCGLGINPGGCEIFRTHLHRPWGPPTLLYNGYQVITGGNVSEAHPNYCRG